LTHGHATVKFPNTTDVFHFTLGDPIFAIDVAAALKTPGHQTIWGGGSHIFQIPVPEGYIPSHTATPGQCNCAQI
jgi:hypothetical protein